MGDCRTCHAEVTWVEMVPTGRRMPLDVDEVDPTAHGAIVKVGRFGYSHKELTERLALKEAISTAQAAEAITERFTAHTSHFSTCPDRDTHRRPR